MKKKKKGMHNDKLLWIWRRFALEMGTQSVVLWWIVRNAYVKTILQRFVEIDKTI